MPLLRLFPELTVSYFFPFVALSRELLPQSPPCVHHIFLLSHLSRLNLPILPVPSSIVSLNLLLSLFFHELSHCVPPCDPHSFIRKFPPLFFITFFLSVSFISQPLSKCIVILIHPHPTHTHVINPTKVTYASYISSLVFLPFHPSLNCIPYCRFLKMSSDPPPTTPTPKATYSFRMTPARLARLTQNNLPSTTPKRKSRNTHHTQSPHNPLLYDVLVTQSQSPSSPPLLFLLHVLHLLTIIHNLPSEETATLTRYRQPSRFTTSISAIPRLTSQFLSALAGPLIIPRNLTTDFLRTLST